MIYNAAERERLRSSKENIMKFIISIVVFFQLRYSWTHVFHYELTRKIINRFFIFF